MTNRVATRTKRTKRTRKPAATPAPANIAADPIGSVLLLPAWPEADPSVGVLLQANGTAVAVRAVPGHNGQWQLPEPSGTVTPADVRAALKAIAGIRREAGKEVERLISLLDRIGPDPDLEENGDNDADDSDLEPSLGSDSSSIGQTRWAPVALSAPDLEGPDDDLEPSVGGSNDGERELDQSDDEHSAGWQNQGSQLSLSVGGDEAEPSLGSFDRVIDQTKAWRGGANDREIDPTEPPATRANYGAGDAARSEARDLLSTHGVSSGGARMYKPGEVRYIEHGGKMIPIIGRV